MKTKIGKQLRNACLFAYFVLWSISALQAQSPSNYSFSGRGVKTYTEQQPPQETRAQLRRRIAAERRELRRKEYLYRKQVQAERRAAHREAVRRYRRFLARHRYYPY